MKATIISSFSVTPEHKNEAAFAILSLFQRLCEYPALIWFSFIILYMINWGYQYLYIFDIL